MKQAAGTLLYRRSAAAVESGAAVESAATIEVLLVHPSGNYNRHAPWGIPKGLAEPGESLEQAARRETWEETGLEVGALQPLGSIDYRKSRKRVHAFAGAAPEAPPRAASWEIDRAEFFSLEVARSIMHPDQSEFVDRLEALLAGRDFNLGATGAE